MSDALKLMGSVVGFLLVLLLTTQIITVLFGPGIPEPWQRVSDRSQVRVYCDPWGNRVYILSGVFTSHIAVLPGDCRR